MRPPEFTGGNAVMQGGKLQLRVHASMRPPEFTGGNAVMQGGKLQLRVHASMRPPEFTGGNAETDASADRAELFATRFNEAAGIHRRKLEEP